MPWPRRWLFARKPALVKGVTLLALTEILAWYCRHARRCGHDDAQCGAIAVVQRFGSALNLDVHFHMLVPDGCFATDPKTHRVRFFHDAGPTTADVKAIVVRKPRLVRGKHVRPERASEESRCSTPGAPHRVLHTGWSTPGGPHRVVPWAWLPFRLMQNLAGEVAVGLVKGAAHSAAATRRGRARQGPRALTVGAGQSARMGPAW